jgi:DNA-binding Lrp family transcriptional regulator
MRFEELYERQQAGRLSQEEAAEILNVDVRTVRRWMRRYEGDGLDGLIDKRIGQVSARRAPVDQVLKVQELYRHRYAGFTAKHFHEKLVEVHRIARSYTWTKPGAAGSRLVAKAKRRGAHRKRQRRPLPGMMLHQDGSRHEWVAGRKWDLILTMDAADNTIYSAFFVEEEGTMSSFLGVQAVIETHGLFASLYVDRGSHYFLTPKAGGKVDKTQPTQFHRALNQLGIELIAAYSPEARGRSERLFRTLQDRCKGACSRRHPYPGSGQSFLEANLPARAQPAFQGRTQRAGQRLRTFHRHALGRHPLGPGNALRRQRQHRALRRAHPANPARHPSLPLRQSERARA